MTYFYKGLKKGTYYLQFFEDEYYSVKSGPYSFVVKPAPVTVYTNVEAGKKSFTVKWQAGTGHGYQIQYALNKKFTKSKKSAYSTSKPNNSNSVSKKIKKLKAKKRRVMNGFNTGTRDMKLKTAYQRKKRWSAEDADHYSCIAV